ncbi:MAG: DUF4390 domain-containing protein [Gammaproteobacteria bacterium]
MGRIIFRSVLASLFLCPAVLYADLTDGFIVENAQLKPGETDYVIDADIQYNFSHEVLKALEHGIALQIDIEIQAKQSRKWLWDKIIRKRTLSKRLEHHPISNQYLVTDLNTGVKRRFQSLSHALEFLGTIRDYPFVGAATLEPGKTYNTQIRARLNTESLPAPLRLSAYIASDWQLSSPWFKWTIQQ